MAFFIFIFFTPDIFVTFCNISDPPNMFFIN